MVSDVPVKMAFMFPPALNNRPMHHLGIAYIQAFLARQGITSQQILPRTGNTLVEVAEQLLAAEAPIVGFCCYDINFYLVRALASLIKRRRPDTVIIVGGPSATFSDEVILKHTPEIDLSVRFEGEETTLELAEHILAGRPIDRLEGIAGITFRLRGTLVRTPDRPLFALGRDPAKTLDGLPSPYLEGMLDGTEGAGLLSSRGCTHHCTYCNFAAMSRHTLRLHSHDRIIRELKVIQAVREHVDPDSATSVKVSFNDDAFTLHPRRAKEICRRIIREGIKLKLSCMCRADNLDEELIMLLKEAGFASIMFGIESAVPEILRNIKKVCSIPPNPENEDYLPEKRFLARIEQGIAWAKKHQMRSGVSIILGLPGETAAQGRESVEFVRKLGVDYYTHNYLVVHPGTEIFDTAPHHGIQVTPSRTTLPFKTTHAYNVKKIPALPHSLLRKDQLSLLQSILKFLAGGDIGQESGTGVTSALVDLSKSTHGLKARDWLSQVLAVNGKVFVLVEADISPGAIESLKRMFSAAQLPAYRCYFLKSIPGDGIAWVYHLLEDEIFDWTPQLLSIPFQRCLEFLKKPGAMGHQIFPLYRLEEHSDLHQLAALAEIFSSVAASEGETNDLLLEGIFLDGCRWSRSLCPAVVLRRVIIGGEKEIRPCLTGKTLGGCNTNIQEMRKHTRELYHHLLRNRHCQDCPVKSRCSQCLFPYPFSPKEYCEIQQRFPDLGGVVISTNLVNTIYALNN
jgi:radical SAM superfamily enzyme YgiQ (UPF0313 family)